MDSSRDEIFVLLGHLSDFDLASLLIKHVLDQDEYKIRELLSCFESRKISIYDEQNKNLLDINERSSPRLSISMEITIQSSDRSLNEVAKDISQTGMFINTCEAFSLNEKVLISFFINRNDHKEQLFFESSVVRLHKNGIGVEFQSMSPDAKAFLNDLATT